MKLYCLKRKKGGGVGTHFKNESDNHRMLVKMILARSQLCVFSAVKHLNPEQEVSHDSG